MTVRELFRTHTRTQDTRTQDTRTRDARAEESRAEDAGAAPEGGRTSCAAPAGTAAAGRAAQELGLRRAEFELAVHLGLIAVVGASVGGRPRVPEEEIARLREQPGFPDALAERVRTVGTAAGAALLDIAPARFTRLARAGCFSPVTFYLNRYRAVVWLYLADELAAFSRPGTRAARRTDASGNAHDAGVGRRLAGPQLAFAAHRPAADPHAGPLGASGCPGVGTGPRTTGGGGGRPL